MEENQDDITNLNKLIDEIMRESVEAVEEVQLEPQPGEGINVEQGTQSEEEEQAVTQGAAKKQRINEHTEKEATEDDKDFISKEAQELWNKILFDKEFVGERGFGKLISPFSEVIEKRGWGFFCEHKVPEFSSLASMVGIKDESVYVSGVWVPFGHRRINEMFKLRDLKHGSMYKKFIENPNYEKILNLLTAGEGKWETTKKNPHHAIKRGALTEEAHVWFYFICSVVIPTKHLCSVREQEAIILYAFLKGYKMNIGILIEESIRGYHHSNKRGLIPHPTTITRLCLLAGVKGMWEEEEKCPRVSPLTLTGVTRGPKGKKQKEIMEVDATEETTPAEENETREMEAIPEDIYPAVAEEAHFRMSPFSHSYPKVQEHFPSQAEGSRSREDNIEIMEMLRSMKREMEERE